MEVDDWTFGVDFSYEGVSTLRERVKEKLKEFIGDYTNDTLVATLDESLYELVGELVRFLLRSGREYEPLVWIMKDSFQGSLGIFFSFPVLGSNLRMQKIKCITVGNEVLTGNDTMLKSYLLPAMQTVYGALENLGLRRDICDDSSFFWNLK